MKEINISVDGQLFQGTHWMLDQDRMADEVRNHFGDRFDRALNQYDFSVVWRECLDREFMLWMLRRSPHGRSYDSELLEFVRSLDAEHGLDPLDEMLACKRVALQERYAEEIDRDERVSEGLSETVRALASIAANAACGRVADEAIYERFRDSASERGACWSSTYQSLMKEQAKRLRDLIVNPFVAKTSVGLTH